MEGIRKLSSLGCMEGIGKDVGCRVLGPLGGIKCVYPRGLIKFGIDMGENVEKSGVGSNPMKYPDMGGVECITDGVRCISGQSPNSKVA